MAITSYERAILSVLLRKRIWLNTTQIADLTGISWNTALKYLQRMYNRGWLSRKGNYWRARR
jgi:DNA-binding IclR family transcriptional regulator